MKAVSVASVEHCYGQMQLRSTRASSGQIAHDLVVLEQASQHKVQVAKASRLREAMMPFIQPDRLMYLGEVQGSLL